MSARLTTKELLAIRRAMSGKIPNPEEADQNGKTVSIQPVGTILERLTKLNRISKFVLPSWNYSIPCRHISVCLVIIDTLHHEDIWRSWVSESRDDGYSADLCIHAKFPDKIVSPWVRARTLPFSFLPEWNSIEVVCAMVAIMQKSLENESCGRIIFGTETCIPLYPLQEAGRMLFQFEMSWLDAYNMPKNQFEVDVFQSTNELTIPRGTIWKALPGWISLTRRHVKGILDLLKQFQQIKPDVPSNRENASAIQLTKDEIIGSEIIQAFRTVFAPEEIFFPTMLAILGFLTETRILTPSTSHGADPVDSSSGNLHQVLCKRVTFAKWRKISDANPIQFANLNQNLLKEMRADGCIFGRKFTPSSILTESWRLLVKDKNIEEIRCETSVIVDTQELEENTKAVVSHKEVVAEVLDYDNLGLSKKSLHSLSINEVGSLKRKRENDDESGFSQVI